MQRITPNQVTSAIRSLFRSDEMLISRCFQVLDDAVKRGSIIVDNLEDPEWAIVQEPIDKCLYFSKRMDSSIYAKVIAALRLESDVLVGMPLDDPRIDCLPPGAAYDGRVLEFYDRRDGEDTGMRLRQVPADCTIKRLDRILIMRTEWGPDDVAFHGGIEGWEKACFGYGLVRGGEVLSEATVGPSGLGLYEPGVFTQKDHRGKGFGTMVVYRLIQEIEALGGRTFWNCDKKNLASAAIARKLGYRIEREFRCLIWKKTELRHLAKAP